MAALLSIPGNSTVNFVYLLFVAAAVTPFQPPSPLQIALKLRDASNICPVLKHIAVRHLSCSSDRIITCNEFSQATKTAGVGWR